MPDTAPTIASAMQRGRKGVLDHLAGVGATSSAAAVTYQSQQHADRKGLAYLLSQGVVRMTQDGRYWMDEAAADEWRRSQRTQTALIAGGAVAALGVALWLRRYRQPRS